MNLRNFFVGAKELRFSGLIVIALLSTFVTAAAQSASDAGAGTAVNTTQQRIDRARALAAAHQLAAAASELESLRSSVKDDFVRNVTSVLLMGICLEEANYARAESLLEENFQALSAQKDSSVPTYFPLAGQAVNGARAHLLRYRTFGINVTDPGLPAAAASDLDRLRSLLERMVAQAKEITKEGAKGYDALALLEDVSGIRLSLARDGEDRNRWEVEYASARQKLAASQTQIASLGNLPGLPARKIDSSERPKDKADPARLAAPSEKQETSLEEEPDALKTTDKAPSTPGNGVASVIKSPAAPKSVETASPLNIGILNEKATTRIAPVYPQIARSSGVSGLVRVKVVLDESGLVVGIVWAEGPMVLRQAAQDAARQWKFRPTIVDGRPIRVTGYLDFGFSR